MVSPLINVQENEIIASFDAEDIAEGFGLVTYFLYASENDSTTTYHLSKEAVASSKNTTADFTSFPVTYVFNSPTFNRPRVINGSVFIEGCIYVFQQGSGSDTSMKVGVEVYHFDGSTETQLGSTVNSPIATGLIAGATRGTKRFNIAVAAGRKKFKKGDSIRIKLILKITAGGLGESADGAGVGIDPLNRDGEANTIIPSTDSDTTTIFKIRVPFENID